MSVLVLMSAYNGEKYLPEQLDSIISQKDCDFDILIRDDASNDKTVSILEGYERHYPEKIKIIKGKNIGPAQSFYNLMLTCSDNYDFYAFADQDDIWLKGKLKAAEDMLKTADSEKPALYYCAYSRYSDDKAEEKEFCPPERAKSYKAVLNTFATTQGCTMVFNRKLLMEIRQMNHSTIDMHDSFVHAACLLLGGTILCDDRCFLYYRIHANQVTGGKSTKIKKRIENFLDKNKTRISTCRVLSSSDHILDEYKEYLELLTSYDKKFKSKMKLLSMPAPEGMDKKQMKTFKIRIITNRY